MLVWFLVILLLKYYVYRNFMRFYAIVFDKGPTEQLVGSNNSISFLDFVFKCWKTVSIRIKTVKTVISFLTLWFFIHLNETNNVPPCVELFYTFPRIWRDTILFIKTFRKPKIEIFFKYLTFHYLTRRLNPDCTSKEFLTWIQRMARRIFLFLSLSWTQNKNQFNIDSITTLKRLELSSFRDFIFL